MPVGLRVRLSHELRGQARVTPLLLPSLRPGDIPATPAAIPQILPVCIPRHTHMQELTFYAHAALCGQDPCARNETAQVSSYSSIACKVSLSYSSSYSSSVYRDQATAARSLPPQSPPATAHPPLSAVLPTLQCFLTKVTAIASVRNLNLLLLLGSSMQALPSSSASSHDTPVDTAAGRTNPGRTAAGETCHHQRTRSTA
jgi:hypothetical protein